MMRPVRLRLRRAAFWLRFKFELARRIRRRARGRVVDSGFAVVYVYPLGESEYDLSAQRFVASYRDFPPLYDHSLHVVFNGPAPSAENIALFDGLQAHFHRHDDSGWDIGAFQRAAREIDCELILCLGGNSYFRRSGWLRRMAGAVSSHGDGLYGASASYERDPHIRTTAFWCDPLLLRAYPKRVRSYQDRYDFEASEISLTRLAEYVGLGCWLVTWCGEYAKKDWRSPPNIFRRGDQSNSLVFDRHFDLHETVNEESRLLSAARADSWDASGTRAR